MLLQHFATHGRHQVGDGPRNYTERLVYWQCDLDTQGHLLGLVRLEQPKGKRGLPRLIPDPGRTSGVAAGLAADTAEYVFGWSRLDRKTKQPINDPRTSARHAAFRDLIDQWAQATDPRTDRVPHALAAFYQRTGMLIPLADGEGTQYVTFTVRGQLAHESATAADFWAQEITRRKGAARGQRVASGTIRTGTCLICTETKSLVTTVPGAIPGSLLPGAANKVRVISVNDRAFGYDATTGLVHAPLCFDCADHIITGAIYILSRHKIAWPGQRSATTWWTSIVDAEQIAAAIINTLTEEGSTNPEDVQEIFDSLHAGIQRNRAIATAYFRAATLGANVSRMVVRDWIDISLPELLHNVRAWMTDHLVLGRVYPLRRLALACGRWQDNRYVPMGSKADDRLADIQDTLLHAALTGTPVPHKLAGNLLQRIWRDQRIDGPRLALLQLARRGQPVITIDSPEQPASYAAGRILALLDYIQYRASDGKVNRTFTARALGAARTRPGLVLRDGVVMAETAWLPKIARSNKGKAVSLQAELAALQALITDDSLTRPLAQAGQHLLVLGLGHQRHHMIQQARAAREARLTSDTTTGDEHYLEAETVETENGDTP